MHWAGSWRDCTDGIISAIHLFRTVSFLRLRAALRLRGHNPLPACNSMASCGTCGEDRIYNEYGDEDYLEDDEREDFLKAKRLKKRRGGIIYFR